MKTRQARVTLRKKPHTHTHNTYIYRSTSAAITSSCICNSGFISSFASHGGWLSSFKSDIAVVAEEFVVSDPDFSSRAGSTKVASTGNTLKAL